MIIGAICKIRGACGIRIYTVIANFRTKLKEFIDLVVHVCRSAIVVTSNSIELGAVWIGQLAEEADIQERMSITAQALRQFLDEPPQKPSWFRRIYNFALKRAENDDVPDQYRELFACLKAMYHDPADALASWHFMALDGASQDKKKYPHRDLANWTLRHRPEYLGCVKAEAYLMGDDKRFKEILRKVLLPKSQHVPEPPEHVNVFAQYRKIRRVHQDRAKVITELKRLFHHYQEHWPDTWLAEVTERTVEQAKRIEIGQKIPEIMAPCPMEVTSKWKPSAGGQSVVSFPGGDDSTPVPHAENENEVDQKQVRSTKSSSRSGRKSGRDRSR